MVRGTQATSASFLGLLERDGGRLPLGPGLSPSSSTTIHRCQALPRWLGEHSQVQLVFGPPSCPHYPVERIWGTLKTELANTPVETMAGRVRQIQAFFGERSQERRLGCALPFRSP
jgi:hypothetical protein